MYYIHISGILSLHLLCMDLSVIPQYLYWRDGVTSRRFEMMGCIRMVGRASRSPIPGIPHLPVRWCTGCTSSTPLPGSP